MSQEGSFLRQFLMEPEVENPLNTRLANSASFSSESNTSSYAKNMELGNNNFITNGNTMGLINGNPEASFTFEPQMSGNVIYEQQMANEAENYADMPVDMTIKQESIPVVDSTVSEDLETPRKEDNIGDEDEYLEILQECPVCHKMFVRSDYENFHIHMHKISEQDNVSVPSFIEETFYESKPDLNANDVWNGLQAGTSNIDKNFRSSDNLPLSTNQPLGDFQEFSIAGSYNLPEHLNKNKALACIQERMSDADKQFENNNELNVPVSINQTLERRPGGKPDVDKGFESPMNLSTNNNSADVHGNESQFGKLSDISSNIPISTNQTIVGMQNRDTCDYERAGVSTDRRTTDYMEGIQDSASDVLQKFVFSDSLSKDTNQPLKDIPDDKFDVDNSIDFINNIPKSTDQVLKGIPCSESAVETDVDNKLDISDILPKSKDQASAPDSQLSVVKCEGFSDNLSKSRDQAVQVFPDDESDVAKIAMFIDNVPNSTDDAVEGTPDNKLETPDSSSLETGIKSEINHTDMMNQEGQVLFKTSLDGGINLCARCPEIFVKEEELVIHLSMSHPEEEEVYSFHDISDIKMDIDELDGSSSPGEGKVSNEKLGIKESDTSKMVSQTDLNPIDSAVSKNGLNDVRKQKSLVTNETRKDETIKKLLYDDNKVGNKNNLKTDKKEKLLGTKETEIKKTVYNNGLSGSRMQKKSEMKQKNVGRSKLVGDQSANTFIIDLTKDNVFESKLKIQKKLVLMSKDLHECPVCYRQIYQQCGLKNHMKIHASETEKFPGHGNSRKQNIQKNLALMEKELHECSVCSRQVASLKGLEIHLKAHNIKKENLPVQENQITIQENSIKQEKDMHESPPFMKKHSSEEQAEEETEELQRSIIHKKLASVVGGELHECPVCHRLIYGKVRLEAHMKTHSPTKQTHNHDKQIVSPASPNRETHNPIKQTYNHTKRTVSPASPTSSDEKCLSKTPKKRSFSPYTVLKCSECPRTVLGEYRLQQHMEVHKEVKGVSLIKCPKCSKIVLGKSRLKQHMQKHTKLADEKVKKTTDMRLIECPNCSKHVRAKHRLLAHLKGHFCESEKKLEHFGVSDVKDEILIKCLKCSIHVCGKHRLESHLKTHKTEKANNLKEKETSKMETGDPDSTVLLKDQTSSGDASKQNVVNLVECSVCHKMQKRNYLHLHMQIVHSPEPIYDPSARPYECKICSARFTRQYGLTRHQKIHSGIRDYSCDKCGKSYVHKDDWKKHVKRHTGALDFPCRKCQKAFISERELTEHLNKMRKTDPAHSSQQEHFCNECGKGFTHRYKLIKHTRIHRKGAVTVALKHTCTKCGKKFANRNQLESHMPLHKKQLRSAVPKMSCDKCDMEFTQRFELDKHLKTHVAQSETQTKLSKRKTSCRICGKCFSFKLSLIQHLKNHSEIRDYSCNKCGKYFPTKHVLEKHVKSHSEIEFSCSSCEKTFMYAKSLRDHQKKCLIGKKMA